MDEEVVDLKFLIKLGLKGENHVIHWCMRNNLIPVNVSCPKCGRRMKIYTRKSSTDGYVWRCKRRNENPHDVVRTLRKDTWFYDSQLPVSVILQIIYMWYQKLPNTLIKGELHIANWTVVDWKMFCRKVCREISRRESTFLGGPGVVVEIGENQFNKKRIDRGPCTEGMLVIGGVERDRKKCFFKLIENQTKQILLSNIKENILPGSVIVSDCWKEYDCLSDADFMQLEVNDGFVLKNPERPADTNAIEKEWVAIRDSLPRIRYNNSFFESYLAEYVWRKNNSYKNFMTFLTRIAELERQVSGSNHKFKVEPSDEKMSLAQISGSEDE